MLIRYLNITLFIVLASGVGYLAWEYRMNRIAALATPGIASGSGRIEAVDIDVSARATGLLKAVTVRPGDFVEAGQVVASMDVEQLEARRKESEAQLARMKIAADTARTVVLQRQAERDAATATVSQNQVQLESAQKRLARSIQLSRSGSVSDQALDDDRARTDGATAILASARASLAATEVAINTAQSQVIDAEAALAAFQATITRIDVELRDSELKAPRSGRVQYLAAQPGEVMVAGKRILNIMDAADVYMTFFLQGEAAGRAAIGGEVRLVLDGAPQQVIPARISFISEAAQFTPKTAVTAEEREGLTYRLQAQIPKELLQKHLAGLKAGLSGRAYVRTEAGAAWPSSLSQTLAP